METAEALGFRSSFVKVNGLTLHCVEKGSGPLVLLLHGWPEFWYSWRHALNGLSAYYRVVAPDMRGFNLSDRPGGIAPYALSELVGDVIALLDHYGADKVHLVGHDWGGIVAWQTAIQHPERLHDLVILNCPHPDAFRRALKQDWRQRLRSWYMAFFLVPALPDFLIRSFLPQFFQVILANWTHRKDAFTPEDLARYTAAYRYKGAVTASLNYYRALFKLGPPRTDRFRTPIPVPILVLWGTDDKALGHAMTKGMDRYAGAGYQQIDIDHCSHWIQHEVPDRVNSAMLAFWAKGVVA